MNRLFFRVAKMSGGALTLISFGYLFYAVFKFGGRLMETLDMKTILLILPPTGILYGILYSAVLIAWHLLVKKLDSAAVFHTTYRVYARTQIAKYLPGNVFHYIGRQVMMKEKAGISHLHTLTATAYETLLMAGTAVSLAIIGIFFLEISEGLKLKLLIMFILVACSGLISVFVLRKWEVFRRFLPEISEFTYRDWFGFIAWPSVIYFIFYICMGSLLLLVSIFALDVVPSFRTWGVYCALYAGAWLIGFVTPGSPGGMGVREMILTTGLTPVLGAPCSLGIALLARGITVTGDCVLYGLSFLVGNRTR